MCKNLLVFVLLTGCVNAKYEHYVEVNKLPAVFNENEIDRYLLTQYKNVDREQVRLIYYKDEVYIADELAVEGARYKVSIKILDLIANCAIRGCNRIIHAHNHVGQFFAKPSSGDVDTDALVKERLSFTDIKINLVVVADHDTYWIR